MSNGFIYPIADQLIQALQVLNLVEWLKRLTISARKRFIGPVSIEEEIALANVCIDGFIVFKWALLMVVWLAHVSHPFVTCAIFYLIFFNVFTYFYHHVWKPSSNQSPVKARRRFVTAAMAVLYSILCYAYLYDVVFPHEFGWPQGRTVIEPLYFSLATSLTVTFGDVTLKRPIARVLCCTQLINMFVFVATVLSPGVPQQVAAVIAERKPEEKPEELTQEREMEQVLEEGLEQKVN